MNGYLGRLVTRHRQEPALRPRAASRFALDTGTVTREAQGEPEAPTTTPARDPRLAAAARRSPAATADSRILVGTVPAEVMLEEPGSAQASSLVTASRPVRAVADSTARLDAGQPDAPAGDARAVAATAVDISAIATGRRLPMAPATIRRVAVHPDIASPAARATRRSAALRAPAEPHVVQVHIGRVEVRAVMPAAPPRPASRPSSPGRPLSLDQYLDREPRS